MLVPHITASLLVTDFMISNTRKQSLRLCSSWTPPRNCSTLAAVGFVFSSDIVNSPSDADCFPAISLITEAARFLSDSDVVERSCVTFTLPPLLCLDFAFLVVSNAYTTRLFEASRDARSAPTLAFILPH